MLYLAYLDEFGHVGPYVSRDDPQHNDSPVFGIGGLVLPHEVARDFSSWFYRLRNKLLDFEIKRSGYHPARWEKKGSALLTTGNINKYPVLTRAMRRILAKIRSVGGFVVYVGFEKRSATAGYTSRTLYGGVLRRVLMRLDSASGEAGAQFLVVLDDNDENFSRDVILRKAQQVMFGADRCSRLIETPLQVESVIYHNVQCADWICGLLGRYAAYALCPDQFSDFRWANDRFHSDLQRAARYSRILTVAQLERDRFVALARFSAQRASVAALPQARANVVVPEAARGEGT